MDLQTRMVEHHVWLTGGVVRLAERLTDEQLDQPIELDVDDDQQTIRSLLSRLVGRWAGGTPPWPPASTTGRSRSTSRCPSLLERLAAEGPTYLTHVREVVAAGQLKETFVDALKGQTEVFTYGGMIAQVLTFAAHLRTLVALAFASHAVENLGWGDPMLWVAQPAH